jgi:hypothetical protein
VKNNITGWRSGKNSLAKDREPRTLDMFLVEVAVLIDYELPLSIS